MNIIEKIKIYADSITESNNKTLFHSDKGFRISSPNVNGVFKDIILDDDKLLFFSDTPFARVIFKKEWNSIEIIK